MSNGHVNYMRFGQNKGSNSSDPDDMMFFEEQLFEAKHALFTATTVREIKFLQSKINYLEKQVISKQKKDRTTSRKARTVRSKKPKIIRFRPRAML